MKYLMAMAAMLVLASLAFQTPPARAQSREEKAISNLQREFYDLRRAIEGTREGDTAKIAQLDALIRQAIDATHSLTGDLERLQKNMTQNITEQQSRVAEPLAVMKAAMEQVSQDTGSVRTSIDNLNSRMSKNEAMLDEILKLVRTLNAPPVTPPPPQIDPAQAAESLFMSAQRDYGARNYDLALRGFGEFATQYKDDPKAPEALYYMGLIYDQGQQYDQAVAAFDSVVERYGEVEKAKEARFSKANSLQKAGKKPEALREFRDFKEKYPRDERITTVNQKIRELGGRP